MTGTLLQAPVLADLDDAAWLATPAEVPPAGRRPAYELRTHVSLTAAEAAAPARLTATAHGIYEAWINGERVGDCELTPGATTYRATLQVQSYDVTGMLREGDNELRLTVSDGWFRGRCGATRVPDAYGERTGALAALVIGAGTEAARTLTTGQGWEVAVGAITAADLMDGQTTDLTRLGHEQWAPAELSDEPLTRDRSRLAASPSPAVRRGLEVPAVSVTRLASGRQVVDFGRMLSGWVRVAELGPAGTRLILTHFEVTGPDGDLTTRHIQHAVPWLPEPYPLGQVNTIISRGVAGDVVEPHHTTHGFRYVAVDGADWDLDPTALTAVEVRSDLTPTGDFSCSHEDLNRLHANTVRAWHSNSCELPTDCPQRERWGYTGDYQIFARTAAHLDDVRGFTRKWLRSLADEQYEDGTITNVAPSYGVDDGPMPDLSGSAGWGDAATIVPWEMWRAYGEADALAEAYPMMVRWVEHIEAAAAGARYPARAEAHPEPRAHDRYLWDTGFHWGEWTEPDVEWDPRGDFGIVATAYLARSARIVAEAAVVLGREDDAARFGALADRAAEAWRTEFIEDIAEEPTAEGDAAPRLRLTVPTQASYVRALAFDLVLPSQRPAAAAELARLLRANGNRLSTGFLSTGMLLPVLVEAGYTDLAYEVLLQREEPGWMVMLDRGATAIWEDWNGLSADGVPTGSQNHYSKGAVVAFLHEYTAGIRPAEPGYAAVEIAPVPGGGLTSARASLDTARGTVSSSWVIEDGAFRLTVRTPPGTPTTVRLPDGSATTTGGGEHTLTCAWPA
ncbi:MULTISPECIES: family 78 glycoside hydrolase catalytic domain [unclassified Actinomyces]|uniref:family 78 glycoside hydrolase catalytic domain n=1 Tax=unclassified Actinomyces TaxID=2609248 RepID=UPI002016F366|nr:MULTISPECIES: family 78 glycoside hydrolase catalytic domain [unclassified Actinomyces]MCL3777404.1 family 78 glycoside hydrolase catalytic domain [Actinomyces sp. AC-20-1]MCL3789074.1 family 78 glycoside hydrolase catalytic domain [Actinomyces sp. 187325]MCL3791647.1 family 78 glycoside hydrolase catalytic domain [Actinomyces sp. 186855]MCL3793875.1 family 78 glycoside hydrolase catalytic domain [Actinomyces sp. 217892]